MHGRKNREGQGRAGSPLPADVGKMHDGTHGATRPGQTSPAFITSQPDGVTLAIKLQPRASKNEIGDFHGAELRIKVTAPPVDAAANEALLRLLADTLGCPRGKVELIRGHTARQKVVKIYGMTAAVAARKLSGEQMTASSSGN